MTAPVLTDHGYPCGVTDGDVRAIGTAAARVLRGEMILSVTPKGEQVAIYMHRGRAAVRIGTGPVLLFDNTLDALVTAYGEISNFNIAWEDFAP
jgi:hypothetical protein